MPRLPRGTDQTHGPSHQAIYRGALWPFALLLGSVIAGVALWLLKWILIGVAWGLAGILWGIALLAGWLLASDWVLRGFEIRRAIAGDSHGALGRAAKTVRPEGGGPAGR